MTTRLIQTAIVATLAVLATTLTRAATPQISPAPKPGDGSPPIDIYLNDGYASKPCLRTSDSQGSTYTCRNLTRIPNTTIQPDQIIGREKLGTGEISGGPSYMLFVDSSLYEGCKFQSGTRLFICDWRATNLSVNTYKTGEKYYYLDAFENWYNDTGTAIGCVDSIYKQDPAGIAACISDLNSRFRQ